MFKWDKVSSTYLSFCLFVYMVDLCSSRDALLTSNSHLDFTYGFPESYCDAVPVVWYSALLLRNLVL